MFQHFPSVSWNSLSAGQWRAVLSFEWVKAVNSTFECTSEIVPIFKAYLFQDFLSYHFLNSTEI